MVEKELDTLRMASELNDEVLRLRAVNTQLLEALEGLTMLGTVTEGPREGGVIIGPQGWRQARKAIEAAKETG